MRYDRREDLRDGTLRLRSGQAPAVPYGTNEVFLPVGATPRGCP